MKIQRSHTVIRLGLEKKTTPCTLLGAIQAPAPVDRKLENDEDFAPEALDVGGSW